MRMPPIGLPLPLCNNAIFPNACNSCMAQMSALCNFYTPPPWSPFLSLPTSVMTHLGTLRQMQTHAHDTAHIGAACP